ncbi:hypothetical protein DZC52_12335 [Wenzhouxiangella sediminis]|uniref:VanZ-like domain-containing protein n=2 Tax=Wenzhouxiangella sediminis TaxID=1792836 RepID=A0A3E1K6F1_9GAMM|nr:hypothetical protein DZC52_12335 [Wenzhouxiangella sediminis]
MIGLAAAGIFGLGWWLAAPVAFWGRWVIRGVLAGVLAALLVPASAIQVLEDWVKAWLPVAASASSAAGADWVVHFFSFAGLGALLFYFRRDVPAAAIGAGLIGLGGLTEVLQYFVEGRSAAVGDLVADGIGVGVGYLVAWGMAVRLEPR